jgi:hypothetical protein
MARLGDMTLATPPICPNAAIEDVERQCTIECHTHSPKRAVITSFHAEWIREQEDKIEHKDDQPQYHHAANVESSGSEHYQAQRILKHSCIPIHYMT